MTHDAACEQGKPKSWCCPGPVDCWCADRALGFTFSSGGGASHELTKGDGIPPNALGGAA